MIFSEKTREKIDRLNRIEPNSIIDVRILCNEKCYTYSLGNRESKEDHYFQIGSNTKLFTAALICRLAERGMLELSDPLDRFLTLDSRYAYPTVEDLLTHFGYRPLLSRRFVWNYLFRKHLLSHNLYRGRDSAWLEKYLQHTRPPKKRRYFYSDINYAILGLIVEKLCQRPYEDVMEEFLRSDLGLLETSFSPPEGKALDSYFKGRSCGWMPWERGDIYRAAGGLCSTAEDAFRFVRLAMDGEHSEINVTLKKRRSILFGKAKLGIGYGWHCYVNGRYFFHKGGVVCFRTNYYIDTKKRIGVSIVANVLGDKRDNTTTLGMSIYRDVKALLKSQ